MGRDRLLRLARSFPERDSGLFQVYKLIFARKGEVWKEEDDMTP